MNIKSALSLSVLASSAALCQAQWVGKDITPSGESNAFCGAAYGATLSIGHTAPGAADFIDSSGNVTNFGNPANVISPATMDATNVAGYFTDTSSQTNPFMWSIATQQFTNLMPAGDTYGEALGSWGPYVVGFAGTSNLTTQAYIWYGSANSKANLTPIGYTHCGANAIQGINIAGYIGNGSLTQAALWQGFNNTPTNLDPFGFGSSANALDGTIIGGSYTDTSGTVHPCYWTGAGANTVVDLLPAGRMGGQVNAVQGNYKAGFVLLPDTGQGSPKHAVLWSDYTNTVTDLDSLVPAGLSQSEADAISSDNKGIYIVGKAQDSSGNLHAVEWTLPRWSCVLLPMPSTGVASAWSISGRYVGGNATVGGGCLWDLGNNYAFTSVGNPTTVQYMFGVIQSDGYRFYYPNHMVSVTGNQGILGMGSDAAGQPMEVGQDSSTPGEAVVWSGILGPETALNMPAGLNFGQANCVNGGQIVGNAYDSGFNNQGLYWPTKDSTAIVLTPSGSSFAQMGSCDSWAQAGGYGVTVGRTVREHACIWHGTPGSVVDLQPSGWTDSFVAYQSGDWQFGYAYAGNNQAVYAWEGTAASAVNLQKFWPAGITSSQVYAAGYYNGHQILVGAAETSKTQYAILYVLN